MKDNWKLVNRNLEYENPVLRVEQRDFQYSHNDSIGHFTVVSMKDWAVIVPITSEGKVIMVRQYRVATDEVTYEFPGGALESGEDALSGAERELMEETGFDGEVSLMSKIRPNPAFMDNFCYLYFAENCRKVSGLNLDPFEDLEPVEFSMDEVEQMIKDGKIIHSITIAAYGAFRVFRK